MNDLVYYQAGHYPGQTADDVEVMREVTADMMAATRLGVYCAVVNNDYAAMQGGKVDTKGGYGIYT